MKVCYVLHAIMKKGGPAWGAFLTRRNSTRELVGSMVRMFLAAPWSTRLALVGGALRSECGLVRGTLLRAVFMGVLEAELAPAPAQARPALLSSWGCWKR